MFRLRGPFAYAVTIGIGTIIVAWVLLPYYFLFLTSIMSDGASIKGFLSSAPLTFANFEAIIFGKNSIWFYMINTVIIAGGSTLITMLLALPAGYGLSRLRHSRPARTVYLSMFVLRMVPPITLVIPYFIIFNDYQLLDTHFGLILATIPILLPFAIWIIRAFFDGVPVSIEEAARIDGCGHLRTLIRIVIPVVGQGVSATAVLVLLQAYVEFLLVSTLTRNTAVTLPVYLTSFQSDYFVYMGHMMAATLFSMVPMVFLYSYSQRYMTQVETGGIH